MTKFALLRALEAAGVKHPFLEDCPCGECDDFFGFGRGRDGTIWIAFSMDPAPMRIGWSDEVRVPLAKVSMELRRVLGLTLEVLSTSDPLEGLPPLKLAPAPPPPERTARELAARAVAARAQTLTADEHADIGRPGAMKRWATKRVSFGGRTLFVSEWARVVGISAEGLRQRLKKMSVEEALTRPIGMGRRRRTG